MMNEQLLGQAELCYLITFSTRPSYPVNGMIMGVQACSGELGLALLSVERNDTPSYMLCQK
jgi:hypothetical protein